MSAGNENTGVFPSVAQSPANVPRRRWPEEHGARRALGSCNAFVVRSNRGHWQPDLRRPGTFPLGYASPQDLSTGELQLPIERML
jgi:hypothetical protein